MATIIVTTSIPFTADESRDFIQKVGEAATSAFRLPPTLRDVYLYTIPEYQQTPQGDGQITFFVYTAPGKAVEYKRDLVKSIQNVVDGFFADKKVNTVVIIKEHADETVGTGGRLRQDILAGK